MRVKVEEVGEVFEDIGWEIPIFLLFFPLIVILPFLSKNKSYAFASELFFLNGLLGLGRLANRVVLGRPFRLLIKSFSSLSQRLAGFNLF